MREKQLIHKGIVLAGGSGTRLYPLTRAVSKQLLPVYDKPMVYYPLSVLMLAGIRDILLISTPQTWRASSGSWATAAGWAFPSPTRFSRSRKGLAQASLIGREFIGRDRRGPGAGRQHLLRPGLSDEARPRQSRPGGATNFAYRVKDPERYGVVELDAEGRALSIEEKPQGPRSNYAVTGTLFLRQPGGRYRRRIEALGPRRAGDHRRESRLPRARPVAGRKLGRGFAWLDTGTQTSLLQAANFVGPSRSGKG